jgi:hypothetical protein
MSTDTIQLNKFCWIELAALLPTGKMVRDKFVHINDSREIAGWCKKYNNTDIFTSIQRYERPGADSGFIVPVYFDIDCGDNLNNSKKSSLILCELIIKRLRIDTGQIGIFFSGYKGFHITVDCEVFNAFPSKYLLPLYKKMARNARKQGVEFLDGNVYSNRRLWRLCNSVNSKSGLYKIPLSHKELMHLDIDKIKELAEQPRSQENLIDLKQNKDACRWYRNALKCMERIKVESCNRKTFTNFKNGWRIPPCIEAMQKTTLPDGIRHNSYLILARFYSWINMHPEQIKEKLLETDKRHPISDPDSIERIIKWSAENTGFAGCGSEILQKYCQKNKCFYYKEIKAKKGQNEDIYIQFEKRNKQKS